MPVAVNCWFVPSGIDGIVGLTAIETRAAGATVSVAVALTEFKLIPIEVVPVPKVVAKPFEPDVLLMVATAAALDVQCPVCVMSCVLPSV